MQLSAPRAGDLEDSKPLAHCENYRLGAIVRLELLENPAHVIPHCLLADAKAVADLLVRQPLSDTRQDVYLSSGQWWRGTLGQGPDSTRPKPVTRGLHADASGEKGSWPRDLPAILHVPAFLY